ncbi:acyltransferase family protein [Oryzobacter telluris]|uniref:acyltransferase family protein n=1 Tax=Oryzobacter telluris TaxID=3149179 RepID=UPI00370DC01C
MSRPEVPTAVGATRPAPQVSPKASARIDGLDYLRFVAALAVVAFHWTSNGPRWGQMPSIAPGVEQVTVYGHLGVDVFFLISGYVILITARGKSARSFVVSRLVRLFPTFWVALVITVVVLLVIGGRQTPVGTALCNLTMVPDALGCTFVDGSYWSLAYELAFYAFVLGVILVGGGQRLPQVIAAWTVAMAVIAVVRPGAAHHVLTGDFYTEFAVGALLAEVRHDARRWWVVPALAVGLFSMGRFAIEVGQLSAQGTPGYLPWMPLVVTLAAATVLLLMPASGSLPGARTLGILTFPLYLLHQEIGYAVLGRWATPGEGVALAVILLGVLLGASWALHRVVEVRYKPVFRRAFDRGPGHLAELAQQALASTARRARSRSDASP